MKIIKKILKSFLKFFLLSALIHIGILIISAIKNGDIKYFNYFRIIGLEEFWPKISNTHISDLISGIIMIFIISGFFGLSLRKRNNKLVG